MRSIVKKIVNSERIISLQIKAEPISVLFVVYMSTSGIEDDREQEFTV